MSGLVQCLELLTMSSLAQLQVRDTEEGNADVRQTENRNAKSKQILAMPTEHPLSPAGF